MSGNVVIATSNATNPAGQNGDIFVNAPVSWTSSNSLTLSALRDINVNAPVSWNSGGSLTLSAVRDINVNTSISWDSSNSPALSALRDINVNASISWSSASQLTLSAFRNINVYAGITNTGGAPVILQADNTGTGVGTVSFTPPSVAELSAARTAAVPSSALVTGSISTSGPVSIYYNPVSYTDPKTKSDSSGNPYSSFVIGGGPLTAYMLVNNSQNLQNINSNLTGTYALGTDIAAGSMVPIGSSARPFVGILDGQNHTISNAIIGGANSTGASDNNIGMFGAIGSPGVVQNLFLSNFTVTANSPGQFIGTLAGSNAGTISNVNASGGTVSGGNLQGITAGGLVGQNGILFNNNNSEANVRPLGAVASTSSAGTIQNSTASVAVTVGDGCSGDCSGGMNVAGGLAGSNVANSTISNSYAGRPVTGGSNSTLGGLVGLNGLLSSPGFISNSYASAPVSSTGTNVSLGGLAGRNEVGSTIATSFATGSVTDTATANNRGNCSDSCTYVTAGGLVGQNYGVIGTDPTSTNATMPALNVTCTGGFTCATGNVTVGNGGTGGARSPARTMAGWVPCSRPAMPWGGTTATSAVCSATTRE